MKEKLDISRAQDMKAAEIAKYLEDREKKFAREYLVDGNATQAAIRAGYKPGKKNASAAVQGSRMLRDETIKAYRLALIREELEGKDLSKENVLIKLNTVLERCMQATPVMEWSFEEHDYVPTGEYQFNAKGAISAIEAISKMLGYDAPQKHEIKSDGIDALIMELSSGEKKY